MTFHKLMIKFFEDKFANGCDTDFFIPEQKHEMKMFDNTR